MLAKRYLLKFSQLFLFCLSAAAVQAQISPELYKKELSVHPRLMMDATAEVRIKKMIREEPVWKSIHEGIISKCETFLTQEPVQHIKIGKRLLDKSRIALHRIFYLSYGWRITGDKRYLERAEKELLAISVFKDWNPSHFLDVAEMSLAAAIGYDWLYHALPASSRAAIRTGMINNGIMPSLERKYSHWLKINNNWNQVCNAGVAVAALAIAEEHPEFIDKIVNRAIHSIRLPMQDYGPDGTYIEGYGYWGYGTSFNVIFLTALEQLFNTDFGLSQSPGFLKSAAFMVNMTGPTGSAYNFFDSGSAAGFNPAMLWLADKLKDPTVLWVEKSYLQPKDNKYKKLFEDRLLPLALLWGVNVDLNKIQPPKSTFWTGGGPNPVALMRSSWTDPGALFIGTKGGSPGLNHGHMDVGSFVAEADGLRWAVDLGLQSYITLESKGVDLWNMKQNSQRWKVLRYNNFYHNTLTLNNELQDVKATAPILSTSDTPGFRNAVIDMTSAYPKGLTRAVRGLAMIDSDYMLVRDELETGAEKVLLRWSFVTPASPELLDQNTIQLKLKGKKMRLKVDSDLPVTLKTWSAQPVYRYDAENPGLVIVGFETEVPANSSKSFTVLMIPEKAVQQNPGKIQPLNKWPKK